ncbi:MAG TPA: acyl-CoA dehydrogenase family protein [Acidimicrobiales bacterium]|nr:acyl-CoA dehydrogenase family protein [Acidimicrobiales bacterium]
MDFRLGPKSDALREELRSFLDEFMTPEREERLYRTGVSHDPAFTEALVEHGWQAPGWSEEEGGAGLTPLEMVAMHEELTRAEAPTYAPGVTVGIAKIVAKVGTPEQRADIVPRALRGEIIIAMGYSEPEAGSDVAAARTRAVRDGEEWVINGQKMFTTNGHIADYIFLLTRTNPDVPKHKGLTMFLVPTDHPGFEAQAVYTLSGERTNITFFHDVRVPDSARIGDVDKGWSVMNIALQDEHSAAFGSRLGRMLDEAEAWARTPDPDSGHRPIDDPDVRTRLARAATAVEISLLMQRRNASMLQQGEVPVIEGPMTKLVSSEALVHHAQDLVELMGPDGLRSYLDPSAPQDGRVEHYLRFSLGTTIYAGTSEIQRTIIAQRGLGLPR